MKFTKEKHKNVSRDSNPRPLERDGRTDGRTLINCVDLTNYRWSQGKCKCSIILTRCCRYVPLRNWYYARRAVNPKEGFMLHARSFHVFGEASRVQDFHATCMEGETTEHVEKLGMRPLLILLSSSLLSSSLVSSSLTTPHQTKNKFSIAINMVAIFCEQFWWTMLDAYPCDWCSLLLRLWYM